MPRGPNGQKRKADVIGNAVLVMKIATGQVEEAKSAPKSAAAELGSKGGGPEPRSYPQKTGRHRQKGGLCELSRPYVSGYGLRP